MNFIIKHFEWKLAESFPVRFRVSVFGIMEIARGEN